MRGRLAIVAAAAFVAATLGTARAAEKSIEEMLKVIEQKLAAGPADGPARVTHPRPGAKVERYEPSSEKITALKKKIGFKIGERFQDYNKRKYFWGLAMLYIDTQRHKEAWEILNGRFLTGRVSFREQHRINNGEAHREAAKIAAIQGGVEQAEKLAQEAINRAHAPHLQSWADGALKWVKGYEEGKKKVEQWEAAYAEKPEDSKLAWQLANAYRHNVLRSLDEVIFLQDIVDRFPEHGMVKSGEVEWRLAEGCSRYGLYDEATALYIKICKAYPKHHQVKRGEGWWRAGEGLRRQGKWKEARNYYQLVLKHTPKHSCNQKHQNQNESALARRIRECNQNIN
jgi:tetratricopeptide (TPR) repeat protein